MNLSDKPCYPSEKLNDLYPKGLTLRERLIIAGFGNPKFFSDKGSMYINNEETPFLLLQVDRLIKEMEGE